VFKAVDQGKGTLGAANSNVAIKVLTFPIDNPAEAADVLSRDIQSLQESDHPNVARVMGCERQGYTLYLPMELLAGESLQDRLDALKGPMPKAEALRIIKCLTDALEFAHGKNVVHGHLRPSNVIITDARTIKVTDFALARVMGAGRLDPRDDVFALACIAWTLLTGEHPLKGKSAQAAQESGMKLTRASRLSESEFDALSRALEFERSKRTLSSRRFYSELSGKGSDSSRTLMVGVAAVLLLAILIAGYFMLKGGGDKLKRVNAAAVVEATPALLPPGADFRDCPTCPLMKVIAPGQFNQGSSPDDAEAQRVEMPQHYVSIGYPFAIGVYEVTVGQYRKFIADTGGEPTGCMVYDGEWQQNNEVSWINATEGQTDSYPVSCVSWQDAKRFAAWLSARTHHIYRLPSASEWEYAARGGSVASHPWTDPADACKFANSADQVAGAHYPGWSVVPCADQYAQAAPVGQFAPNALGLHDMLGNVSEWTEDCWAGSYVGAPADGSARTDADCAQRELRGGSWSTQPQYLRVSYRDRFAADYRSTIIGFRLVRELSE
jgi:formylglycine-generating enzyme required for sulfatase activity